MAELTPEEYVGTLFDWEPLPPLPDSAYPAGSVPLEELEPALTCFCGAPAVGWIYDVMSDGQCIRGLAVCAAHQEEA